MDYLENENVHLITGNVFRKISIFKIYMACILIITYKNKDEIFICID